MTEPHATKRPRTEGAGGLTAARLDASRFVSLLEKLIGEAEHLQNHPAQGLFPKEDLAAAHVLELLEPHSVSNGGPLLMERVSFTEGRSNLIVTYPCADAPDGTPADSLAFVGSHMDVVPANPENWTVDPFKLMVEASLTNPHFTPAATFPFVPTPAVTLPAVTPHLSTPILSRHICHTPICHTPISLTPICHTPICHTPISHTPICHTPISLTRICHTPICHTPILPSVSSPQFFFSFCFVEPRVTSCMVVGRPTASATLRSSPSSSFTSPRRVRRSRER